MENTFNPVMSTGVPGVVPVRSTSGPAVVPPSSTSTLPASVPVTMSVNSTSALPPLPPPSILKAPSAPPLSIPQALSATSLRSSPQLPAPPILAPPVMQSTPVPTSPQSLRSQTVLLPQATDLLHMVSVSQPVTSAVPPPEDRGFLVVGKRDDPRIDDPLLMDTANMPGKGEFYGATATPLVNEPMEDWQEKVQTSESKRELEFRTGKNARYGHYGLFDNRACRLCGMCSLFVILPWFVFTVIVCALVFAYHHYSTSVWLLVLVSLTISALIAAIGVSNRSKFTGSSSRVVLAVLCAFATFIGTLVGLWAYHRIAAQYWLIEEGRTYTNVLPGEPAISHADAGTLIFSTDSRVDLGRVVGYKSEGIVYCVAPILKAGDAGMSALVSRAEYWAAGTDCCHARSGFSCGQAWDHEARAGFAKPESISTTSALFPGSREQYLRAAKEAAAVYGLVLGEEPLFVDWVGDINVERDLKWHNIIIFVLATSGLYFCFSGLCATFFFCRAKVGLA